MDRRSTRLLFKKHGLLIAIILAVFGLGFMILVSYFLALVGVVTGMADIRFYNDFAGIISRLIAFILMLEIAYILGVTRKINFTFKNFFKTFNAAFIGYGISFGFLYNAIVMNTALGNSINFTKLGLYILATLSVGLFEELLLRGIVMNILRYKYKNIYQVILFQALIFMTLHLVNYFLGSRDVKSMLTQLCVTFIMGAYYGYIYYKTKSFFGIAFMHAFYDFCVSFAKVLDPTGELGKIYFGVDKTIILYSVLFILFLGSLKLFVKTLRDMKKIEEELAWMKARFCVPFFYKSIHKKCHFNTILCKNFVLNKENLRQPWSPHKT